MAFETVGQDTLRAENVDSLVKGFALQNFVMKQVLMTPKSSSWLETYYRETETELTATRGIPRLSGFPHDAVKWEKDTAYMKKSGLESEIAIEDVLTNNIDVLARSLLRIARGVVKVVDDAIYTELTTATGIQTGGASATWDNATRADRIPHEDIAKGMGALSKKNYMADTIILHPTDFIYLITNDYVMDSFDASGPDVMKNGNMGKILGLKILVTNSASEGTALILQSKVCGTYREVVPMTTSVEDKPGISKLVRAWEIGVPFVTDPHAIYTVTSV